MLGWDTAVNVPSQPNEYLAAAVCMYVGHPFAESDAMRLGEDEN
jgi:hypothetical protein